MSAAAPKETFTQQHANIKRVLVLNAYHEGFHWTDRIMQGIQSVFASEPEIELYISYMDTKRYSSEAYFDQLAQLYATKYRFVTFDAILSSDDHALDFLLKYRDTVFPGVPVVFCGINDFKPSRIEGRAGFTGVYETYDVVGTLDLMLSLHPETKRVAVILDETVSGYYFRQRLNEAIPQFAGRVEFDCLEGLDLDTLEKRLKELPAKTLLLWAIYLRTGDGISISVKESVQMVAQATNLPTYCIWDVVGYGVIGGKVTSPNYQGQTAAEMVLQVLRGTPIERLPVSGSPMVYLFDYAQMQRFGISPADLPEGSLIMNQPFSLYQKHKRVILTTLSLIVFLVLVIVVLLYYIHKSRMAEKALQVRNRQLKANQVKREQLVRTLQFKNKELQDIVYTASHDLRSPLVNIEGFCGELKSSYEQLSELLGEQAGSGPLDRLLKQDIPVALKFISAGARKLATCLDGLLRISRIGRAHVRRAPVEMNQLVESVRLGFEYQIQQNRVTVSVDPLPDCVGDREMVDQVFTNLIGNAIKYLDPSREGQIRISGWREGQKSIYCVFDNGIGIAPAHQQKVFEVFHRLNPDDSVGGEGLGLTIVKRILDRLDGRVWIESESGKGSKFYVELPAFMGE